MFRTSYGGLRQGIPTVRDRVAQEVLRRLLSPLFEPEFHENSHGFRPGRSCHGAIEGLLAIWRQGFRHVLDADISGFFDAIPHRIIVQGLTNVVADGNILNLVQKFLTAGVMEDGVVQSTTLGTPQGGVLSPLLANIARNFFDWHLDRLGLRFIRHNLDAAVIAKLNSVIRGVSRYFGTWFSTCRKQFRELDEWLRVRLRCLRYKRKSRYDNRRIKIQHQRNAGCVFLSDYPPPIRNTIRPRPSHKAISSQASANRKVRRASGPPSAGNPHAGQ